MPSFDNTNIISLFFTILGIVVILSMIISVHEAAHAFVAHRLGDATAKLAGRVTLNPSAHIDPIGTILVPIVLLLLGGFIFGWAKPTPINPLNFKNPRRDSAITAFAGPASNFAMAIFASLVYRLIPFNMLEFFISMNLILGIFNLLPIPPLDGFKIVLGIVPKNIALQLSTLENYGPMVMILFLIIFIMFFSEYISAVLRFIQSILIG